MKKTITGMLVAVATLLLPLAVFATGEQEAAEAPSAANVSIWYWGDDLRQHAEWYSARAENVVVDIVPVNHGEYYQKWATAFAADGKLPDVGALEMTWRQRLINLDAWELLEQAPYNLDRDDIFGYAVSQTTNDNGEIVAVEMGMTPASMAYKRNLAGEYFGAEAPEDLEAMFPDWAHVLAEGKRLNEATGGDVYMFASPNDLLNMVRAQLDSTIVSRDGVIDEAGLRAVLSFMLEAKDHDLYDPQLFEEGYGASFVQDNHIFYANPIWAPDYIIKGNDPDSMGRWGIMDAPGGNFSMGGNALAISSGSEAKDAAWDFIREVFLSEEGAQQVLTVGALVVYKPVYETSLDLFSNPDPYFAGQDVTGKFIETAGEIEIPSPTRYDASVTAALGRALELMIRNDAGLDEMMEAALGLLRSDIEAIG